MRSQGPNVSDLAVLQKEMDKSVPGDIVGLVQYHVSVLRYSYHITAVNSQILTVLRCLYLMIELIQLYITGGQISDVIKLLYY